MEVEQQKSCILPSYYKNISQHMSQLDNELLKKYIDHHFEQSIIPSIMDYIRIDNLSRLYDAEWNTNGKLEKAAQHIQKWVESLAIKGLSCEVIKDPGYSPLIFTEIKGELPETLFFYGHFDKQPPFKGWMQGLGPTIPKIIDGKLYGRGGADDGYSTYSTILAIKALQEQGISLPRCVMVTEGDQQSGSGHMSHYLQLLKERIGNPQAFFCLDSGTLDYERVWLTTSLRGNMVGTLKVKTNQIGYHSGSYSGVLPSCFRVLRILLNRLQNYTTGQINRQFFVDIPPNRYKQMKETAQMFGQKIITAFPFFQNTQPITSDPLNCLIQRNWHPSVTVIGQTGFPQAETSGNVLHPEIEVRVGIRLPPSFPSQKGEKILRELLLTDVPYGAEATLTNMRAASGWNANQLEPCFQQAIRESSQIFYGKELRSFGEGAAIPLMGMLQKIWPGRPYLITGVLGPMSNAHGPNQFLHIDYTKKLTCCLAYCVSKFSENLTSKKNE